MTSNTPPPGGPQDPNQPDNGQDLPSYGSVPPPPSGGDGNYPPPPGGGDAGFPPPPPGSQPGYGGAGQETNKKALASMIVGIVSLVLGLCCGLIALGGIASIILGVMGRNEIAASGGAQKGNGMAITGIVTGAVALVLLVVGIILLATGVIDYNFTTDVG